MLKKGIRTKSYFNMELLPDHDFSVDVSLIQDKDKKEIGFVEVIQDITETNELKRAAEKALKDGIHQAALTLEKSVEVITTASEEISAQIEQSTKGSETQANQIQETAAAMEEMNASILEVAKTSTESATLADEAKLKAQDGNQLVKVIIQSILNMQEIAANLKSDIGILGTQVAGISDIVIVISNIADQTNLLALNAAIEAARQADAGRGFAVVADEVRKLAEKTQVATKEVEASIKVIQDNTKKNITNVDNVVSTISEVNTQAEQSGIALSSIVTLIEQAATQVRNIAIAAEEQSSTSEEINKVITEVSTIAGETTTAMQQSSIAITELAKQSLLLKSLIDDMKK